MLARSSVLATLLLFLCACPSKTEPGSDGGTRDAGPGPGIDAGTPSIVFQLETATGGSFSGVNAAWIAARSGDGGWVTPQGSNGAYRIFVPDPAGHFTVAVRCPYDDGSPILDVYEGTLAEWDQVTSTRCPSNADGGLAMSIEYANVAPGGSDSCGISFAEQETTVDCHGTARALQVPPGSYDLLGFVQNAASGVSRFVLQHDVSAAVTTRTVDFGAATAPVSMNLSVANPSDDTGVAGLVFLQLNHPPSLYTRLSISPAASGTVAAAPASALGPSDYNILEVKGGESDGRARMTFRALHSPSDVTLTLPDPLTSAAVKNVGSGSTVQMQVSFTGGPAGAYGNAYFVQGAKTLYVTVGSSQLSSGTYTLPDLSQAPGFDTGWNLQTGVKTTWRFNATTGSRSLDLNQQMLAGHTGVTDGAEVRTSTRGDDAFYP